MPLLVTAGRQPDRLRRFCFGSTTIKAIMVKNCGNILIVALVTMLAGLLIYLPKPALAVDARIQDELKDPSPTLNPLRKAIGEKAYERAMKSGKYRYIGNAKCRLCHRDFFVGRKKDPHIYSYELLIATGHQKNERCLGCHTTGYNVESGFKSFKRTPKLIGVQCEGCHGPGSEHVRLHAKDAGPLGIPMIGRTPKSENNTIKGGFLAGADNPKIIKRMCLSCHTKRWERSFPRTAHDFQAAYDLYKTPLPGDDDGD